MQHVSSGMGAKKNPVRPMILREGKISLFHLANSSFINPVVLYGCMRQRKEVSSAFSQTE